MNFERFSKLWDALVTNRPKSKNPIKYVEGGMTKETEIALIEYGQGKKDKILSIRELLNRPIE